MTAVWESRFDTQLPLEADDSTSTQAYLKATNFASDTVDHETSLFEHLLGGANWATPSNPKRILQLGSDNGKWVALTAAKYPQAEVIGVELPELASQAHSQLPNARFVAHEFEATEVWGGDAFDFIYTREAFVRAKDWGALLKNIYTHLVPGGWVEFVELDPHIASDDGTLTPNSATQQLFNAVSAVIKASGKDSRNDSGPKLVGKLQNIGFTNVQTKAAKAPLTPWAKDPHYKKLGLHALASAHSPVWEQQLQYAGGLSPAEAKQLAAEVIKESQIGKVHAYSVMRFVIAQKPQV